MRCLLLAFSVVIPALAQAAGPFEGVIQMKVQAARAEGTMTIMVSPLGARSETRMANNQMNHAIIHRKDKPDVAIMMDMNQRIWGEIDKRKTREMTRNGPEETFTVKKLGREKIQGLQCEHVLVSGSQGSQHEMWLTRELGGEEMIPGLSAPTVQRAEGMATALKEAGVEGFPMKAIHGRGETQVKMEVTKVERRSVPSLVFEIPEGFTKQQNPMGTTPSGIDAATIDKLKNASPEERRRIIEEMKAKMGR